MILGQILGGALGDVIGRIRALYLVMTLQIFASLSSAFLVVDQSLLGWSVFEQLAFWRLLLGIGCGGVYPLAALLSSEVVNDNEREDGVLEEGQEHGGDNNCDGEEQLGQRELDRDDYVRTEAEQERNRLKMLAVTFSTQGIGFVTVPIVSILLLMSFGERHLDTVWRMILAFGSMPGLMLMYLRWHEKRGRQRAYIEMTMAQERRDVDESYLMEDAPRLAENQPVGEEQGQTQQHDFKPNLWEAIQGEDDLFVKLVGTAGACISRLCLVCCHFIIMNVVHKCYFLCSSSSRDVVSV
jgi:PHS family inorganic phosphate transporter-like MFS transporter